MKRGFTLIEILIAVAIIAILTAIGIVSYSSVNKRSRDAKRFGDIEQIRSALEMYRSDNGFYPKVNTSGFDTAVNLTSDLVSTDPSYLPAIPSDPQGTNTYYYEATDLNGTNYYGYCLCANLETQTSKTSTCGATTDLPANCMYGVKNP